MCQRRPKNRICETNPNSAFVAAFVGRDRAENLSIATIIADDVSEPLAPLLCTNVHPGRTLAEVEAGLDRYTVPTMREFGQPIAAACGSRER